jgi:hypothetical protein
LGHILFPRDVVFLAVLCPALWSAAVASLFLGILLPADHAGGHIAPFVASFPLVADRSAEARPLEFCLELFPAGFAILFHQSAPQNGFWLGGIGQSIPLALISSMVHRILYRMG